MDKWLRNINVVRIASLLIGILLWVIVHLDEQVGKEPSALKDQIEDHWIYNVNVTVTGLDTDYFHFQSIDPQTTNIVVRGKAKDIAKVSTRDGLSQIVADLSGVEHGPNRIELKATGFPSGVQVVHMYPSEVNVVVEQIQKKEVPIEVLIKGQPAAGYKAGDPIVNPSRVLVSAAESVLNPIQSVRAEVDISGASKAVQGEYKLVALDGAGNVLNVPIMPATANVEVPITIPYRTVPLQIRLSGTPPPGYSVASYRQSDSQITIYGPEDVVSKIEMYDALEIDLSEAMEDIRRTITIPLKDGVESVHPAQVEVIVDIAQSVNKTFSHIPVRFRGENDSLVTEFSNPDDADVAVTVEGAPSQISSLLSDQIEAIVDVSNLPPGEHLRELKINLPVFVKLTNVNPNRVTIKISEPVEETTAPPDSNEQPSDKPPTGRPPDDPEEPVEDEEATT